MTNAHTEGAEFTGTEKPEVLTDEQVRAIDTAMQVAFAKVFGKAATLDALQQAGDEEFYPKATDENAAD